MSKKKLKFDDIKIYKKEFHASKQPIALYLVNINIVIKALNILLVTKKMIL